MTQERWDGLFADLEAQFDAEERAELEVDLAERTAYEWGRRTLVHRLRAATGRQLRWGLRGRTPLVAVLFEVGPDWAIVRDDTGECLVPLGLVNWVEGLPTAADATDPGPVWAKLDLRRSLRRFAAQRTPVLVETGESSCQQGTFVQIYADHVDLRRGSEAFLESGLRAETVRSVLLDAIVLVRVLS